VDEGRLDGPLVEKAVARLEVALGILRDRPTAREVGGMDDYRVFAMAKASVATLRDPSRRLPLAAGAEALAVILDDDDRPGREEPILERREEFGAGILRRTPKSADPKEVLGRAAVAERIFVFLYGDVRAWKGRAGLAPELAALLGAIQAEFADRTVLVSFGNPGLAGAEGKAAAVCAWDDAPVVQRATLDLLLSGRSPTGRPPYGPDPLR
jgi:hypothetical protein